MTKENSGIYLPNDVFLSRQEIIKKNMKAPIKEMVTELPLVRDFRYWGDRMVERQKVYQEVTERLDKCTINFDDDVVINLMSDLHVGAIETDYQRIQDEITAIVDNPRGYLMLMGDAVDGFFFNPAQFEQIEQAPEQFAYLKSMMTFLGEKGKLLVGWGGDHDGWIKKMGIDPYVLFSRTCGAYYMQGVGYVTINVGEQEYKIVGAHRIPGHSMYNNSHPEMRLAREVQGGDIYVAGHTHKKGHSEQAVANFDNSDSKNVHYISLGPYKASDEYAKKKGFPKQGKAEMFGCAIELKKDSKQVIYHSSILDANK
jgi:hypothetical protein